MFHPIVQFYRQNVMLAGRFACFSALLALLQACGGGSDGDSNTSKSTNFCRNP